MVEHAAHNRGVAGSIPATATAPPAAGAGALRELALAGGLLTGREHVLVALSGGSDSTALLLAVRELGCRVTAAHYDHRLRPGSRADARHAARLCAEVDVPLLHGSRRSPLPAGSPEAAARRLRYDFLERARRRTGADLVALGHTRDDLVEGAVLHLLRGCGLAGLRGMPARRGTWVRPLLGAGRDDLRRALRQAGVAWIEDPTNADPAQARARVRHQLLPALERDRPGLAARIGRAALAAARLEAELSAAAAAVHAGPAASLDALLAAPAPVRLEALRRLFVAAGGADPGLSRRQLTAMDALACARRTGGGLDLPGRLRFRVRRETVEVVAASNAVLDSAAAPRLQVRRCAGCAEPGAVHLRPGLELRAGTRRPGLRLRPAAGRGSRKLQDVLVDAGVPRWERDRLPLVFAGDQLVWVPGIAAHQDALSPAGQPGLHVKFVWKGGRTEQVLESRHQLPGDQALS